ncbi:hypothetical protein PM082_004988 [Marasmius tenuissimus]|nr:hypothetical protein PM082_004988 [Marasmius tenuissimus]
MTFDTVHDSVTITYKGSKASQLSPNATETAVKFVRQDVAALKVAQPPKVHISVVGQGVVRFYWETKRENTLHQQLIGKLHSPPENSTPDRHFHKLLIQKLDFQSNSPTPAGPVCLHSRSWLAPSNAKRPKAPLPGTSAERTTSWLNNQHAQAGTPGSSDIDPNMIATSMRDSGDRLRTGESTLPTPPASASVVVASSSHQAANSRATFGGLPHTPTKVPSSLPLRPNLAQGNQPVVQAQGRVLRSHTAHLTSSPPSQPPAQPPQPPPAQPLQPPPVQPPPPPPAQPQTELPSNAQKAEQLMAQLAQFQSRIKEAFEREKSMIQSLKELATVAPVPSQALEPVVRTMSAADELVLRGRLKMTELQLKEERDKRQAAEDVLKNIKQQFEEERAKRMAAEDTLKDIERECREPFIVPALLDAFITVSNLSSEATSNRMPGR